MKKRQINVLLIEDNPGDVNLIKKMLGEETDTFCKIDYVNRLDAGLKRLAESDIDVVLLDLGLPDSQGLDTFIKVHKEKTDVPIVVLTGLEDTELGVKTVKKGAQDYLVKGQVDGKPLIRAVRYAIERKRAEELSRASLREKEVLLQEIHHRVKNNLQIISSLLKLQSNLIKDNKTLELLKSTQNRIKSMVVIHDRLYKSKDFARINFDEFIQSLSTHLFNSYGVDAKAIKINLDIKDVFLDINTAIPCGLIVNELLSNSLKYAFPDGKKGEISIAIHPLDKNEMELIVSDNGAGLPEEIDIKQTKSLGLHLVTILVEDQLQGDIKLDRTGGTRFYIRIKVSQ
jgi:two-component sensor histidine kinase/CheY-like chemotaxis protein